MSRSEHRIQTTKPLKAIRRRLSRIRHFRGHGIHSPYIYRIVREVFLTRKLFTGCDRSLYDLLKGEDSLRERYRVELQNIYTLYNFDDFSIDKHDGSFVVITPKVCEDDIMKCIYNARSAGTTIAILNPRQDSRREELCERIIEKHHSTTLLRSGYLLIFNNHLPKQHFQL